MSRRRHARTVVVAGLLAGAALLPLLFAPGGGVMHDLTLAAAYVVMALGLNVIVGFAGLLDLGYVAFFAIGAYTAGYFASGFWSGAGGGDGVSLLAGERAADAPGIHVNFLLVLVIAGGAAALAGVVIGLPTLRLRGDYIGIVTLAFGEIIGRVVANGDEITLFGGTLTAGAKGITPVDEIDLPLLEPFGSLNLRPWYWFALALALLVLAVNVRLRDSRLGRAWLALRSDEVAAMSVGIPLVRTKLLAYGVGAAFGGAAGAFLASYLNTVNADQFEFSFSIFIFAMLVVGGLGSIWGVVLGAIALSAVNNYLLPDVLSGVPGALGLDLEVPELSFGIYGSLLVLTMLVCPEGVLAQLSPRARRDPPARRRRAP
jgi:branched-chain amino acid transport system permease protein